MRTFFALVLVSYLTAFTAPFVVLADEDNPTEEELAEMDDCELYGDCSEDDPNERLEGETDCEYSGSNCDTTSTETTSEVPTNAIQPPMACPFDITETLTFTYGAQTEAERKAALKFSLEVAQGQWAASYSSSTCGEYNSYSHYLEKGDCSADGLVVTELTEVFAPNVDIDDETDKNRIITTYGGICCFAPVVDETDKTKIISCDDTRTLYTKTYTECAAVATNCEKRQWVIGDSGIGIIQLMVKQIYVFGAFAVGTVAVSTMIFQGIKISVSGVSGDISDAKNKILQSLSGIVLLFLSGLILYTINPDFFG